MRRRTLQRTISSLTAAATGGDASALATTVDNHLDSALETLAGLDADTLDDSVQQFIGAVHASDASIDQVLVLMDVDDPDEGDVTPEEGASPLVLAKATSNSLKQALGTTLPDDAPTECTTALQDLQDASDTCAELITALSAEPAADGAEPPADGSDAGDGQAAVGEPEEFATGDEPAPDVSPAPPADDAPSATDGNLTFTMPIMVLEGVDTGDGRYINPDALTWRELPVPVMAITETGFGHEGAKLVGHITGVERFDASGEINPKTGEAYGEVDLDGQTVPVQALKATGEFASIEIATEVADLVRGQFLKGVSVDLSDVVSEIQLLDEEGEPQEDEEMDLLDALFFGGDMREVVTEGRVMGATICPFPAFEGAYIEMDGAATPALQASCKPSESFALHVLDQFGARECLPCQDGRTLTASAGPMAPPTSWFENPQLDGLTGLTIAEDGRIYGHLAGWGSCHTGYVGRCVTPPKSKTDYAYFHTGAVLTAEGDTLPTGRITLGTGHADLKLNAAAAMAHYDNTGAVVADVACGEDAYGIWVAGAMRPDVTELQVRQLRAAPLSGDWRQYGGRLELIAALAVNVAGFPIQRVRALAASGTTQSLVAAGASRVIREGAANPDQMRSLLKWRDEMTQFITGHEADRIRQRELAQRSDRLRRRVHAD